MAAEPRAPVNPDFVDKLFEYVYCDLGQRWEATRQQDEYTLYHKLNMARLLRHLLCDGTPLAQLAAKRHRVKLLFLVPKIGTAPDKLRPIPVEYEHAKPNLLPGYYIHVYDLGGYLGHEQGVLGNRKFTPRDLISFLANAYGGVHLGPYLGDEVEQHLAEWNNRLRTFGEGVLFGQLDQIVGTVLRCLAPLRSHIVDFHNTRIASSLTDANSVESR